MTQIDRLLDNAAKELSEMRALEARLARLIRGIRERAAKQTVSGRDIVSDIEFELEAIADRDGGRIFSEIKNASLLNRALKEIIALRYQAAGR